MKFLQVVLALAALSHAAQCARILMLPAGNASHFNEMNGVASVLLARGHEVYVLFDEGTSLPKSADKRYKVVTYKIPEPSWAVEKEDPDFQIQTISESKAGNTNITQLKEFIRKACSGTFEDPLLLDKLRSLKFDLALVDNFIIPCFFLIPHKLGLPIVVAGSILTGWYSRLPLLPSVIEPAIGLEFFGITWCEGSEKQWPIVQRLCRLGAHLAQERFFSMIEDDYWKKYVDYTTIADIRSNALLTLVNTDHLLGNKLPRLPHVEYVGGITTRPAKPLPADLQKWMDESNDVVVVSFGSRFSILPVEIAERIFTAFGQLKNRFLFRFESKHYKGTVPIPKNVKTMSWLPQNDVLGHNHTRLFITHSGNNGQYEALYHGVPMLCFYIHADQITNARRAVKKGFGLMASLHEFTSEELAHTLTELLTNKTYSDKIDKASRIFNSVKHPSDRAADAIEHVLKYGADHLRPKEAYKLKWWQFYMLDVLATIYVTVLFVLFVVYKLIRCTLSCVCKVFCGRRGGKAKTD